MVVLLQMARQEGLEFIQSQLKHFAAGLWVLLNHLHNAANFCFQGLAADIGQVGSESQGAGAHAVDQLAGRVLQRTEKVRLRQCDAQHRDLQPCKPYAQRGLKAFFAQDALEHQGHDFNRGFLARCAGCLFEGCALLAQLGGNLFHTLHGHPCKLAAFNLDGGRVQRLLPGLQHDLQTWRRGRHNRQLFCTRHVVGAARCVAGHDSLNRMARGGLSCGCGHAGCGLVGGRDCNVTQQAQDAAHHLLGLCPGPPPPLGPRRNGLSGSGGLRLGIDLALHRGRTAYATLNALGQGGTPCGAALRACAGSAARYIAC